MKNETPEEQVERILAERAAAKPAKGKAKAKPKAKAKHAGGRPSKYDAPTHTAAVLLSAARGATMSEIARACEITTETAYQWMKIHPEFSDAVTRAKAAADDQVVNALYRRALGNHIVPPDTKACTVWLGNRRPQEWRDTARIELTGANGGPIEHADATEKQAVREAEAILKRASVT